MPRLSVTLLVLCAMVSGILLAGCPPGTGQFPQAAFQATPREGNPPLKVQFTDESIPGDSVIRAWAWDFGNGQTSTRRNPEMTYLEAGSYTVRLTVTNAYGNDTVVAENHITVTPGSEFGAIGPEGGSFSAKGLTISVRAEALEQEVVYGITEEDGALDINAFETMTQASPTFALRHNNDVPRVYASSLGAAVKPATLELPFQPEVVPEQNRNGDKLQIFAQLDDGAVLPILGDVVGTKVVAQVTNLPAHARYAVMYRPESYTYHLDIVNEAKTPTAYAWQQHWRINFSPELLAQATALRLGTLKNTAPYQRRDFTQAELQATAAEIGAALQALQLQYSLLGLRSPALINHEEAYSLIFFDMHKNYSPDYASFTELRYRDRLFGDLILDPRQLLAIALHNASVIRSDSSMEDKAQTISFANAFAQELFKACFEGYQYPDITASAPADLDDDDNPIAISFMAGFEEGLTAYLGQLAGGLDTARGLEDNEYASLSLPLLFPFNETIADYAVANQEFFFYLKNTAAQANPLGYLFSHLPLMGGVLEQVRAKIADQIATETQPPTFYDALFGAAQAMDAALQANLNISLPDAYWGYARARAIGNSPAAQLRPSDEERDPFTLNEDRFSEEAMTSADLDAATDTVELNAEDIAALADIPPLSSRIITLHVNPLSTELVLTFNAADWEADADGNTMAIGVYKAGESGLELAAQGADTDEDGIADTLIVSGFLEDPDDCYATVYILASNLSLSTTNSLDIVAESFAGLTISESRVLDEFVHTCDPNYTYSLYASSTISEYDVNTYVLNMTSGAWRGAQDVNQTLWQHYVSIVEPPVIATDTALLVISGGSTGSAPSEAMAELLVPFSLATGSIVAVVQAVPNQPLIFTGETQGRSEDAIIAYSYDKYMNGYAEGLPDKAWPALLPMTRAAVRAMDSIQDFLENELPGTPVEVNNFVVTGASKRGWTTWLTSAVDSRVIAAMPIVIDVLNMDVQMKHHYSAYGFYSDAVQDYVDLDVFERFDQPEGASLLKIVDPYEYRDKLTMPKLLTNSTGDQFFLPDSSQFYFGDLQGQNWLNYVPNTDHGLASSAGVDMDAATQGNLLAFYLAQVRNNNDITTDDVVIPAFSWAVEDDGISVNTDFEPESVLMWSATNATARDFRLETIGQAWNSVELTAICDEQTEGEAEGEVEGEGENTCDSGRYFAPFTIPDVGWSAFMVQLTFPGPEPELEDAKFIFTTQVVVRPDTYPEIEEK